MKSITRNVEKNNKPKGKAPSAPMRGDPARKKVAPVRGSRGASGGKMAQ